MNGETDRTKGRYDSQNFTLLRFDQKKSRTLELRDLLEKQQRRASRRSHLMTARCETRVKL